MSTRERVLEGLHILLEKDLDRLSKYIKELEGEDPLAASLLKVRVARVQGRATEVLRLGLKLLPEVSGSLELADILFVDLALAYFLLGEIEVADNYLEKAIRVKEVKDDQEGLRRLIAIKTTLYFNKSDFVNLRREVDKFLRTEKQVDVVSFLLYIKSLLQLIDGDLSGLAETIQEHERLGAVQSFVKIGQWEVKGYYERFLGNYEASLEAFYKGIEECLEVQSAYAAFVLAKAGQITRLTGAGPVPDKLAQKALSLSKKGTLGAQAAVQAAVALFRHDDARASEELLEAAQRFATAHQPLEAFDFALTGAYLAYKSRSGAFLKLLDFMSSRSAYFPGLEKDALLGEFLLKIKPLLYLPAEAEETGLTARLMGGLRLWIRGKPVDTASWHNRRALKFLVYLLLAPGHRMHKEHLAYLLWPDEPSEDKRNNRLYVAVSYIRSQLGKWVLTKEQDFYCLRNTRTDLEHLEDLIHMAEREVSPEGREELVREAEELLGELLPEYPYDKYVEEHRLRLRRLQERLGRLKKSPAGA